MNKNRMPVRIARTEAVGMDALIALYIKNMRLSSVVNRQRLFEAWDEVSGAASFTLGKYFKDGVLYCTLSSSVVRSHLSLRRGEIVAAINERLRKDSLYTPSGTKEPYLKSIVFK